MMTDQIIRHTRTNKKKRIDPAERVRNFLAAIKADLVDAESNEIFGVIRDVPNPYSGKVTNVVIRNADNDFWTKCIAELNDPSKRDRVAVVGTPGIGKSTTAFYLIKLLLERGKTVVYVRRSENQARQQYMELTPSDDDDGKVHVQLFPESTKESAIDSLYYDDSDTYFIVDPGETKANCSPGGDVTARVVIVASPDERHWGGNAFSKRDEIGDGGMFRYFPPWTLTELIGGSTELGAVNFADGQIARLFRVFGGIPRPVFAPSQEQINKADLQRKVDALKEQQVKNLIKGEIYVHAGFGVDQPYGGIVVFKPIAEYVNVELELASDYVLQQVRRRFMKVLWTELAVYPSPIAWQLLEEYLLEALQGMNTYTRRVCVGELHPAYKQNQQIQLGGCNSTMLVGDCTTSVLTGADHVLYFSSCQTHSLYDMIFKIGNIYYAFQVTIGRTHDVKQGQIESIIRDLLIGTGGRELHLFFAVHEEAYDDFVTNQPMPPTQVGVHVFHLKMVNRN